MDKTHMDKILNFWKNMDNFYEKNMVKKKTYGGGGGPLLNEVKKLLFYISV